MKIFTYWQSQSYRTLTHWQSGGGGEWDYVDLFGARLTNIKWKGQFYTLPPCYVIGDRATYEALRGNYNVLRYYATWIDIDYSNLKRVGLYQYDNNSIVGLYDLGTVEMTRRLIDCDAGKSTMTDGDNLEYQAGTLGGESLRALRFKTSDKIEIPGIIPSVHRYLMVAMYYKDGADLTAIPSWMGTPEKRAGNLDHETNSTTFTPEHPLDRLYGDDTAYWIYFGYFAMGDVARTFENTWHKKTAIRHGAKITHEETPASYERPSRFFGFEPKATSGATEYASGGIYITDAYETKTGGAIASQTISAVGADFGYPDERSNFNTGSWILGVQIAPGTSDAYGYRDGKIYGTIGNGVTQGQNPVWHGYFDNGNILAYMGMLNYPEKLDTQTIQIGRWVDR